MGDVRFWSTFCNYHTFNFPSITYPSQFNTTPFIFICLSNYINTFLLSSSFIYLQLLPSFHYINRNNTISMKRGKLKLFNITIFPQSDLKWKKWNCNKPRLRLLMLYSLNHMLLLYNSHHAHSQTYKHTHCFKSTFITVAHCKDISPFFEQFHIGFHFKLKNHFYWSSPLSSSFLDCGAVLKIGSSGLPTYCNLDMACLKHMHLGILGCSQDQSFLGLLLTLIVAPLQRKRKQNRKNEIVECL